MCNMAAAMRKVHISIKNRFFVSPLYFLTLKMETIGENETGSLLKKVCADRIWFNSTKNKNYISTSFNEGTRSKITFSTYLLFGISDAVFSGAFPRACWAISEQVK